MTTSSVFVVPASLGTKPENRFDFKVKANGKKFSVPHIAYLSGEGADYLASVAENPTLAEATVTRRLIAIENPEAGEAVRQLANDQVLILSARWAEASVPEAVEDTEGPVDETE